MPAVEYERPLRIAPLESAAFKKGAHALPPLHRNSDLGNSNAPASAPSSTSSSSAGISIMKPVKSAPHQRRKASYDFMADPFEAHLEDIYAGRATSEDGLAFFESHGYYDVSEANTVAMFRQNFGMKKQFWDGAEHDIVFYEEMNLDTVDLAGLQVLNAGAMLTKNVKRHRTTSGRFELLDDEGNVVDAEMQLEVEREKRRKLRHLELDDDDREALAQEQLTLAVAITVIRTEKTRFKRYFYEACQDEMNRTTAAVIPQPIPKLDIQLPSYSGYLYVLKDTIPHLFRSWHKRWVYLDINTGVANMYKRSYWKSERGSLDLRSVINITRMNQSDICLQCFDGRSILFRSKSGSTDVDMWMNLLQCARRQAGGGALASPALPALPSSTTSTQLTKTTTTTMMATVTSGSNSYLVSTKLGARNEKNILETLLQAKVASNTISPNTITAA